MPADLSANLKKDVNNKYSHTEQPPNDTLRERESVYLVNVLIEREAFHPPCYSN